ncbi:MAG: hypothetical protein K2H35_02420 [Muribaculaceae bacterium]|nr:hypothetical protein [Muribaculaceae bacterium]
MKNLLKRVAMVLTGVAAMTIPAMSQVQVTPYSMYGYGIIGDRATSMQRQMGSVGYAMNSGRQINVMNPASYASIDSLTFLFDMGADVSMLWSKDGSAKSHATGGGLDYVTMQFPLHRSIGMSIGMLPYTSVGYAFGNDISHGAVENQGRGGITMAYLGIAGKVKGFSLGVNVSYNFGNIINDVYSYPSNSGQTLLEHVMQVRDWDINIGAQYTTRLSRDNSMTFGLTYTPKKSLHGKTWVTLQEMTQETLPDTVGFLKAKGNYETPQSFGAGVSFRHERTSRWQVEFDFTYQQWSKAKYSPVYNLKHPEVMVFQGMDFADRIKYAVGGEWVPKLRGNYAQRMAYRIGAYYCDDYLKIGSDRVREYGVTAGVGLHTPQDKTMINIGLEWKRRRAYPQELLGENYFNITVGVNFNELWFWQRKIR